MCPGIFATCLNFNIPPFSLFIDWHCDLPPKVVYPSFPFSVYHVSCAKMCLETCLPVCACFNWSHLFFGSYLNCICFSVVLFLKAFKLDLVWLFDSPTIYQPPCAFPHYNLTILAETDPQFTLQINLLRLWVWSWIHSQYSLQDKSNPRHSLLYISCGQPLGNGSLGCEDTANKMYWLYQSEHIYFSNWLYAFPLVCSGSFVYVHWSMMNVQKAPFWILWLSSQTSQTFEVLFCSLCLLKGRGTKGKRSTSMFMTLEV